jgi:hypothetical protein
VGTNGIIECKFLSKNAHRAVRLDTAAIAAEEASDGAWFGQVPLGCTSFRLGAVRLLVRVVLVLVLVLVLRLFSLLRELVALVAFWVVAAAVAADAAPPPSAFTINDSLGVNRTVLLAPPSFVTAGVRAASFM